MPDFEATNGSVHLSTGCIYKVTHGPRKSKCVKMAVNVEKLRCKCVATRVFGKAEGGVQRSTKVLTWDIAVLPDITVSLWSKCPAFHRQCYGVTMSAIFSTDTFLYLCKL